MTSEIFYDIYRKLAAARSEPAKYLPVLDELLETCNKRASAEPSSNKWLDEADGCLHEIAQSSILFAAAVANWLTEKDGIVLAKAVIHKASVYHLQQQAAEIYDLSNIEEDRAILAGCRLCTLAVAPAVSLGWTLSLAVSLPLSAKTQHAVDDLLRYHAEEFPSTTLRLLASADSPFRSVENANEVIAALKEQENWLEELPRLREFAMTPEMRLTLFSLGRSQNRAMHRHPRKMSILSQFCNEQHFKYANNVAMEIVVGDQVHETALKMSPYRVEVEPLVSDRTDPVSGAVRRSGLWQGVS